LSKTKNLFRRALLEAVDDGLLTLGESGRKAIYFHLQSLYSLKREDIPEHLEAFVESLRKIFGLGAEVIEKAVIKSLYNKLGLKYEEKENVSFLAYLKEAEQNAEREG